MYFKKIIHSMTFNIILIILFVTAVIVFLYYHMFFNRMGMPLSSRQDSYTKAYLSQTRALAQLYWDSKFMNTNSGSYLDICLDNEIKRTLESLPRVKDTTPFCNSNSEHFVFSNKLNSGGYFCVDDTFQTYTIKTKLLPNQIQCLSN